MTRKFGRLGSVGLVLAMAVGLPMVRLAFGEPPSDREVAEQIVANLALPAPPPAASAAPAASSSAGPNNQGNQAITRSPLDEVKRALERASGARRAGDVRHAELLEGLAREWAETARDVVRAVAVEADAGALEVAAADAGLRAERARALLEESIARRGRAEAELEKLTADGGLLPTRPPTASSAGAKPAKGAR